MAKVYTLKNSENGMFVDAVLMEEIMSPEIHESREELEDALEYSEGKPVEIVEIESWSGVYHATEGDMDRAFKLMDNHDFRGYTFNVSDDCKLFWPATEKGAADAYWTMAEIIAYRREIQNYGMTDDEVRRLAEVMLDAVERVND